MDCGTLLNDPEGPDNEHPDITDDNEDDNEGTEDSENRVPDNGGPDNEFNLEGESEDTAASKGSSAGVTAGGIVAGIVAVVVVVVGILVVILVWWKRRMKRLPPTDNEESSSSQPAVDNEVQIVKCFEITDNPMHSVGINRPVGRRDGSVEDFKLTDNPVYGVGIDQAALSVPMGTPERNLVLYVPPKRSSLQGIEEPVTGQGNSTLEIPRDLSGGSNGVNEYNPNENEEDCPHT